MIKAIAQMEPLITETDREAVQAYMASGGWLTEFEQTQELEKKICLFTGSRFCRMAPSGTLALFLALAACGIGPGDEVIVPDLTMAASATAVVLAGATPIFADIEPQTFCLALSAAEQTISPRTKAVMFVSLNGRAPDGFTAFAARCRTRGIRVIEDAAQSFGSFLGGRHLGTFGDCGCFSFSSQKIITMGQGGAVVTDDEALYRKMSLLRDFGRKAGGSDHYEAIGWNLKFTDLQATVGLSQMGRLEAILKRKKQICGLYREHLAGVDGIEVPATNLAEVTPWFIDVLVPNDSRKPLMEHLLKNNIRSREFYPALHSEPAFSRDGAFPIAEEVSARGLWLPSSLTLRDEDIGRICERMREFFDFR